MVLSYVASVADEAEPGQNVDNVLDSFVAVEIKHGIAVFFLQARSLPFPIFASI